MVRNAQGILDAVETLPCPTVAIINGFALGGGFELALACRYRVGIKGDNFSIGLPEVMLGIHPGFGGTVRAVRIAGVRTAMQMMLTGKALRADQARRAGFVDRLVFPADAEAAARELIARQPKPRKAPWLDRLLSLPLLRGLVRRQLIAQVRERARRALSGTVRHHRPVEPPSRAHGERAYAAEAHSIAGNLMVGETSRKQCGSSCCRGG
jgi:3-hydroxyacyl-CoA dehydrogenase/enoyl-CoA hydratase/3-hydroxybutyryl-CoA epimerase